MRIWLLEQVNKLETFLTELVQVMLARAKKEIDHVMPGYTHLQVHLYFTRVMRLIPEAFFDHYYPAGATDTMVAFPPFALWLLYQ